MVTHLFHYLNLNDYVYMKGVFMRIGVYPGSFDPITNGHLDIIKRASKLFDRLIVVVVRNDDKQALFMMEERVELIKKSCHDVPFIEVVMFSGLLVEFVKSRGAATIVKGLRAVSDYEYELQMAMLNKHLDSNIETIFLMSDLQNSFLSSSMVKQVARNGGNISSFVPDEIIDDIKEKFDSLRS